MKKLVRIWDVIVAYRMMAFVWLFALVINGTMSLTLWDNLERTWWMHPFSALLTVFVVTYMFRRDAGFNDVILRPRWSFEVPFDYEHDQPDAEDRAKAWARDNGVRMTSKVVTIVDYPTTDHMIAGLPTKKQAGYRLSFIHREDMVKCRLAL